MRVVSICSGKRQIEAGSSSTFFLMLVLSFSSWCRSGRGRVWSRRRLAAQGKCLATVCMVVFVTVIVLVHPQVPEELGLAFDCSCGRRSFSSTLFAGSAWMCVCQNPYDRGILANCVAFWFTPRWSA